MQDIVKQNRIFLIPYAVLLLLGTFVIIHFSKANIHLFLNQYHSPFFDVFFKYLTYLGTDYFLILYLPIMLLLRYRYAFLFLIVFIIYGIVTIILKNIVFSDMVRPVEYFKNIADLYFIPGEKLNHWKSFPSGHSATAFGIMVCFILISKRYYLKLLILFLACLIAYSRVYLSQHFLIDILAGSFIGAITAIVSYVWIQNWKAPWLDKNILNRKIKANYSNYD